MKRAAKIVLGLVLLLGGAFLILVVAFAMLYEGEWTGDGVFALILGLVSVAVSLLVLRKQVYAMNPPPALTCRGQYGATRHEPVTMTREGQTLRCPSCGLILDDAPG